MAARTTHEFLPAKNPRHHLFFASPVLSDFKAVAVTESVLEKCRTICGIVLRKMTQMLFLECVAVENDAK